MPRKNIFCKMGWHNWEIYIQFLIETRRLCKDCSKEQVKDVYHIDGGGWKWPKVWRCFINSSLRQTTWRVGESTWKGCSFSKPNDNNPDNCMVPWRNPAHYTLRIGHGTRVGQGSRMEWRWIFPQHAQLRGNDRSAAHRECVENASIFHRLNSFLDPAL